MSLLTVLVLVAITLGVFGSEERVRAQAGRYVPWVDEGRQLCVFENYNLPLEKCARLYGEDVVASWPREGSDVGPFNIPGANLGG